jgi:choline dehydrogenase
MDPSSGLKPGRKSSSGEFCRHGSSAMKLIPFLSAGAIHTPHVGSLLRSVFFKSDIGVQILMLSGIGPAAQLAFHNVSPLVDLPGVGEHLMDHPVVNLGFLDKSGHSIGWLGERMNFKIASAILQWTWMGTGPMTTNVSECIARQTTGV